MAEKKTLVLTWIPSNDHQGGGFDLVGINREPVGMIRRHGHQWAWWAKPNEAWVLQPETDFAARKASIKAMDSLKKNFAGWKLICKAQDIVQ